jgi:hypothetical protein
MTYCATLRGQFVMAQHTKHERFAGFFGRLRDRLRDPSYKRRSSFKRRSFHAERSGTNPHDISTAGIAYGCSEAPDWQLLNELIALSREKFGFFPGTIIRTIEYPWFARRLMRHVSGRILDIGAGVNILPLWLAKHGCCVVTIDNHPNVRDPRTRTDWNEWGFLDYGLLEPNLVSLHVNAADFAPDEPFEAIYSVSVLEHMPSEIRKRIISRLATWMAPSGRLYLSFDLVPGTIDLWPLSEGVTVDPEGQHGTLHDLLDELTAAGLRVLETTIRRHIRGSRTDLAFVEAVVDGRTDEPNG